MRTLVSGQEPELCFELPVDSASIGLELISKKIFSLMAEENMDSNAWIPAVEFKHLEIETIGCKILNYIDKIEHRVEINERLERITNSLKLFILESLTPSEEHNELTVVDAESVEGNNAKVSERVNSWTTHQTENLLNNYTAEEQNWILKQMILAVVEQRKEKVAQLNLEMNKVVSDGRGLLDTLRSLDSDVF